MVKHIFKGLMCVWISGGGSGIWRTWRWHLTKGLSINDVSHLRGRGSSKRWRYSISIFSKIGDKGVRKGKKSQKMGDLIYGKPQWFFSVHFQTIQKAFYTVGFLLNQWCPTALSLMIFRILDIGIKSKNRPLFQTPADSAFSVESMTFLKGHRIF